MVSYTIIRIPSNSITRSMLLVKAEWSRIPRKTPYFA
jgi:hypothetical protein